MAKDKKRYTGEELCQGFYERALSHMTKALGRCPYAWKFECITNGLTKRLVLTSADGCAYLALYINRTGIKATAVTRNKMTLGTLWEYLHGLGNDIIIAEFDKYTPRVHGISSDFADVIERMNGLIDCAVASFAYSGHVIPEHFDDINAAMSKLDELRSRMNEIASKDVLHYGVHTKKEYEAIVASTERVYEPLP